MHVPLCESGFVIVTFTVLAVWAAVIPVMLVGLTVDTVSAKPPNDTAAPAWNPLPLIDTDVPPVVGPLFGVTDATAGAATYMKQPVQVPLWESGFVTVTSTRPVA